MIEWELSGFTDFNGKLATNVENHNTILIPPTAEIATCWSIKEKKEVKYIIFPVPDKWKEQYPRYNFDPDALINLGWVKQEQIDTLVDDFVKIADGQDEDILNFVLKWGPLWLCQSHAECFFNPLSNYSFETHCSWFPAEPLYIYRDFAKQACAVLNSLAYLQNDKTILKTWWENLRWDPLISDPLFEMTKRHGTTAAIISQKAFVYYVINRYLGTSRMAIRLHPLKQLKEYPAKLTIETGLGFWGVLWLKIAQLTTCSKDLYICDGCGRVYIRQKKKPKKGQKNFCDKCGSTAAKREWARRHKGQNKSG